MPVRLPTLKQSFSAIFIALSAATFAFSQGTPTRGPTPPPEFQKTLDHFNADVASWNARCKTTRSAVEDSWCKKERARIDAHKAELIALGAIRK
jgi:hypothetical protein